MARVTMGNHSSVLVSHQDRDRIRQFYCDVLGGEVTKADPERDFIRLAGDFYVAFLYGDVAEESAFLRSARAVWLELKSDDVAATRRRILESGLVRELEVPDPHLYFQAPGGQCLRLVGADEDLPATRESARARTWRKPSRRSWGTPAGQAVASSLRASQPAV
jgi:catechol 2,3-dioxygenase-like lactoylglutathione lyase family enzyme